MPWQLILISFCYSYSQTASFPFNCPSFLLDRISTSLAYPSSIRLFGQFHSQTASFPLKYRSSLLPQNTVSDIYKSGIHSSISILVSFFNSYSQRESFPLNCRSIVPVQKYKNPRYPSCVSRRWVRFYYITFIYKKHCLCSSVVHLYQFRYPGVRRSQAVLAFWSVSLLFSIESIIYTQLSFMFTSSDI